MPKRSATFRRAPTGAVTNQGKKETLKTLPFNKKEVKLSARGPQKIKQAGAPAPPYSRIEYIPPSTESSLTPSSHDLDDEHSGGLVKLVRDQTLASVCVGVFGFATDDPASQAVAVLNSARGGVWLAALFNATSSNRLSSYFHGKSYAAYSGIEKLLKKNALIKNNTKGLQKLINTRSRKAQSNTDKANNEQDQINIDQKAAEINSLGAGAGSVIHSLQATFSHDTLVQSGAFVAALGYLGIQIDQAIEGKRWQSLKGIFKKSAEYTRSQAHGWVGYAVNKEYIKDALLKWAPPTTMVAKGGFFCAEAAAVVQHDGSLVGATAIGLAGLFFVKSGIQEFKEQNGSKVKYLFESLVKHDVPENTENFPPQITLDPTVYPAPEKPAKTIYLETPPQHPQSPYILTAN